MYLFLIHLQTFLKTAMRHPYRPNLTNPDNARPIVLRSTDLYGRLRQSLGANPESLVEHCDAVPETTAPPGRPIEIHFRVRL